MTRHDGADQHCGQAGRDVVILDKIDDFFGQFALDLLGQLFAVENDRRHGTPAIDRPAMSYANRFRILPE